MSKSKNHTNHNQARKAHRNPLKKVQRHKHISKRGMHPKVLLNTYYAQKHSRGVAQE